MKQTIKYISLGLCAVLALGSLSGCFSKKGRSADELGLLADGVLSVGVNIAYPPFEQWDDDGKPMGLDIDLAKAVAGILDVEVRFENTSWGDLFGGLDADKYDCVISAVTFNAERAGRMEFSAPYCDNWQAIVIRAGSPPIDGIQGLDGLTVGYLDESTSAELLSDLQAEGVLSCTVSKYKQVLDGFDDLRLGRIDAILCDSTLAEGYMALNSGVFEITWTQAGQPGAEAEMLAIAMKKGNGNLAAAVNDALNQLEDSGRLGEIRKAWLGRDKLSTASN